jgi:hypothetical protein
MTMYSIDKDCHVTKVIITLTIPSIKPDPVKLQQYLKDAFEKHGIEVLFVELVEVEKNELLPKPVVAKIFKHACKISGI